MSTDSDWATDEVRLSLPARPEFVRLARITGSGLASRLGFTYEEVEDLRLALDELCFALVGAGGRAGTLELCYTTSAAAIEVEGVLESTGDPVEPSLSDLASQILAALVDDHAVRPASGRLDGQLDGQLDGHERRRSNPSIWLRKARADQARVGQHDR